MEYPKIETLFVRDEKTFKVDPTKLKNPVYGLINEWEWTEKIDGTNIRVLWNHAEKKVRFGGRTDNAQIPSDLVRWLMDNVVADKMEAKFPDIDAILFGESYGPGIQRNGAGYGPKKSLILFDVVVQGQWWLDRENVTDVGKALGLDVVPYIGPMGLAAAAQMTQAGFRSYLNNGVRAAEGMVGRTAVPLFDAAGHRLIVKLKTKDFVDYKELSV